MTEQLVEPSRLSPTRRAVRTVLRSRELAIAIVLVLLVAAATAKTNSFLFSPNSWRDLLLTPSILIVLAVGQAVVIITRNVDLSVGSVLALTACPRVQGWADPAVLQAQFDRHATLAARVPVFAAVVPWGPPFDASVPRQLVAMLAEGAPSP